MADLGVYVLASLLGAGYLMGNRKQARSLPTDGGATQARPVVGNNVYDSREYYNVAHKEAELVKNHWNLSQDPIKTGIIPMYYNTLHVKQDSEKIPNKDYESALIYDVIKELDPEAQQLIAQRHISTASAINDSAREKQPSWGIVMDRAGSSRDTHIKEGAALDQIGGSLIEGNTDLTHGNMVPFYRGNMTQDIQLDNRAKAGKLELYTGQMKLNRPQKMERGAFFQPTAGLTNIHGSQNIRDLSRFNPNNTGKKHGELPFEQVRVGPGLNKGFTNLPSGGHHPTMRFMPKSELYVNSKIEMEGRVKSGAALVGKRTIVPQVYKNRPDLLIENKKGERNFTSVGAVHGRTLRPNIILRDTHRKKSMSYIAPAKAAGINKPMIAPKVKASRRNNFLNTPFRNLLSLVTGINDFGRRGYKNKLNSRALTGGKTHRIAPRGYVEGQKVRPQDTARKTRKQHYVNNARVYGTSKVQAPGRGPAYNPTEWAARATIKETTENMNHYGIQATTGGSVGQAYNSSEWRPGVTVKETTEDMNHYGIQATTGGSAGQAYNPGEWRPGVTVKETTEDMNHYGIRATTGGSVGQAYNSREWAPGTTIKETTVDMNHYGIKATTGGSVGQSYNSREWAPGTTVKETTENMNHYGIRATTGGSVGQSYNSREWAPRTTVKETTENMNHLGGAHNGAHIKQQVACQDTAKTTIAETTERNDHIGWFGQSGIVAGQTQYSDPARVTIKETTERNNYLGGVSSFQKKHISLSGDKARTTIRETTEKSNYLGIAGAPIQKKHIALNNDKARTTIRETTEKNDHMGHVGSILKKSTAGYSDKARTTIKETTEVDGHMGNVGGAQMQSGRGYMTTNWEAKNTNRQFTGDKEYIGPALSHNVKTTSYDSIYNARFNTNKTKISRGRRPTSVGPMLGHQEINVESKKIDNDRKSRYTGMKSSTVGNFFNPNSVHFTSEKNHLPQHDTRLDVGILDAYKQNPLTQSLSSY